MVNSLESVTAYGRLKRIVRTGWLMTGIRKLQVESVADHTARTVYLTMLLADSVGGRRIDFQKAAKMAILHDLPEAVTLDMDNYGTRLLGRAHKDDAELKSLRRILSGLPRDSQRTYVKVFQEYVEGKSPESKIVRVADKLEALIQAIEYRDMGYSDVMMRSMRKEVTRMSKAYGFSSIPLIREIIARAR